MEHELEGGCANDRQPRAEHAEGEHLAAVVAGCVGEEDGGKDEGETHAEDARRSGLLQGGSRRMGEWRGVELCMRTEGVEVRGGGWMAYVARTHHMAWS